MPKGNNTENKFKRLPDEKEAEIAVLGCVFLEPSIIVGLMDEVKVTDFFDIRNKNIYQTMTELSQTGQEIDATTVGSLLTAKGLLEQSGGIDYLIEISKREYTTANVDSYIKLIVGASIKRRAISKLEELSQKGFESDLESSDYIDLVEREVFELAKSRTVETFDHIRDVADKVMIAAERNSHLSSNVIGLDTGFDGINKYTQGFQKGQLIILAARPAMGKSAMALNLAYNVSKCNNNAHVAVFALEMPEEQLVERMFAADAHIPLSKIKSGNLEDNEWFRLNNSKSNVSTMNLFFDDHSDSTISSIRAKCRRLKAEEGLDFVVIDYLGLIAPDKDSEKLGTTERITRISRGLKLMARELEVPVMALAQLSRQVETREEQVPIMADLRDSGSIEQDADIVMFIYRDDYYRPSTSSRKGEADLIIAKNRAGSTGTVVFNFMREFQKFKELEKGEE